jgi:cell division protein FtsQ
MRRAIMVRLKAKPMLIAIAALVIVMGFGTGVIVVYAMDAGKSVSATIEKLSRGAASMFGLTVTDVLVTGRIETPRSKLLAALGVKRGDPILGFDPHEARLRLLKIGWVAQADVQRRLPNTIFVRITEQKPAAIWQHNGRFKLIGRDGAIISDRVSSRHKNLKILVGKNAPSHVASLINMLQSEPDLMAFVTHATWVGSRRWNLLLKQGIDIRLPAKAPNKAWEHLAALQRKHQLLQKRIRMVDLRVPDKMTVQLLEKSGDTIPGEET